MVTKSVHPPRRFWGRGLESDELLPTEQAIVRGVMARGRTATALPAPPVVTDFALAAPRIHPPVSLVDSFSDTPHDRLSHAYGKSFADSVRMWSRDLPHPPDWVAFPGNEQAVVDILDWAGREAVPQTAVLYAVTGPAWQAWLIAAYGALVAPFTEEMLFRGLLTPRSVPSSAGGGRRPASI